MRSHFNSAVNEFAYTALKAASQYYEFSRLLRYWTNIVSTVQNLLMQIYSSHKQEIDVYMTC